MNFLRRAGAVIITALLLLIILESVRGFINNIFYRPQIHYWRIK